MLTIMSWMMPTPFLRSGFQIIASSVQPRPALSTSAMMIAIQSGQARSTPKVSVMRAPKVIISAWAKFDESRRAEDQRDADRGQRQQEAEVEAR